MFKIIATVFAVVIALLTLGSAFWSSRRVAPDDEADKGDELPEGAAAKEAKAPKSQWRHNHAHHAPTSFAAGHAARSYSSGPFIGR